MTLGLAVHRRSGNYAWALILGRVGIRTQPALCKELRHRRFALCVFLNKKILRDYLPYLGV